MSDHRKIGEKAARKLEEKIGLPNGWLDSGDEPTQMPPLMDWISKNADRIPEDLQRKIIDMIEVLADSKKS